MKRIQKLLRNETTLQRLKGYATFGIMITLLTLGMMGFVGIYFTMMSEFSKKQMGVKNQAFYIALAGAEYGMKQFYLSLDPTVVEPGKSLSEGTFIISYSDPVVTVTGRLASAQHSLSFNRPSDAKCTPFDTSSVILDGNDKIHHIYFQKNCLFSTIIDKMRLTWNPDNGEKVQKVRLENDYVYNNPTGQGSGELLELTDFTVTTSGVQTISKIEFDPVNNVSGKTFTLVVYFKDGSDTGPLNFGPL